MLAVIVILVRQEDRERGRFDRDTAVNCRQCIDECRFITSVFRVIEQRWSRVVIVFYVIIKLKYVIFKLKLVRTVRYGIKLLEYNMHYCRIVR